MHASIHATLWNGLPKFDNKGIPWTADDLLGKGDRAKRIQERVADRIQTAKLLRLVSRPDADETAEMPAWLTELQRNKGLVN